MAYSTGNPPVLIIERLNVFYGGIHALHDVSLTVRQGEIVSIIGANGAGKTTLLRTISGLIKPASGSVQFRGQPVLGKPPHEVVKMGIVHVPEGRRIFPLMTVRENLEMGAFTRTDAKSIAKDMDFVFSIFPRLKERENQVAGTLSGGEQQMLAVGRALMTRSDFLLLDEPSMGLAPVLVKEIFAKIRELSRGKTILLVEQNAFQALKVSDYIYLLETGRMVMDGPKDEIISRQEIKKVYLGG